LTLYTAKEDRCTADLKQTPVKKVLSLQILTLYSLYIQETILHVQEKGSKPTVAGCNLCNKLHTNKNKVETAVSLKEKGKPHKREILFNRGIYE
jgi:hypothetical protein